MFTRAGLHFRRLSTKRVINRIGWEIYATDLSRSGLSEESQEYKVQTKRLERLTAQATDLDRELEKINDELKRPAKHPKGSKDA